MALDGLQPDVGHEALWGLRDCLSGEVLLARSLLSATQEDRAALLREVKQALTVPIVGVISDGQLSIRAAVADVFPDVPHQLCHCHDLREAAKPLYEADRHAKKARKKRVRGSCSAVRSALTDEELAPANLRAWQELRQALEARRQQHTLRYRFRRDPASYLAKLEADVLQLILPP